MIETLFNTWSSAKVKARRPVLQLAMASASGLPNAHQLFVIARSGFNGPPRRPMLLVANGPIRESSTFFVPTQESVVLRCWWPDCWSCGQVVV